MKKIVYVIGHIGNGGAERVISILANASIAEENIIITLFSNKQDYHLNSNVRVIYIDVTSIKNPAWRCVKRVLLLRKAFREISPDIIVSFLAIINMYTVLANLFTKQKVILSERNDPKHEPNSKVLRCLRNRLYKLRKENYFVFQTQYALECFNKKVAKKSRIIYNPIKSELPKRDEKNTEHIICTVARLEEDKNLQLLIRAFSIVSKSTDYILQIFGIGPQKDELLELCNELNITSKVYFMGFKKNVHEYIKKADMFVLPSNYEGISNAMIEALAIGIPTISTDSPAYGAREFIDSGYNGFLIECNSLEQLVEKMLWIIRHKQGANKLGENAVAIRNILGEDKIISEWKQYCLKVVRNGD